MWGGGGEVSLPKTLGRSYPAKNLYKGNCIKCGHEYIPPERKSIWVGASRWSRFPMRAFHIGDTNILVSKKQNANPEIHVTSLHWA